MNTSVSSEKKFHVLQNLGEPWSSNTTDASINGIVLTDMDRLKLLRMELVVVELIAALVVTALGLSVEL